MASPYRHADRVHTSRPITLALTGATALALALAGQSAAQGRLTPTAAFAAGLGVGMLAMVGLPSVSQRVIARSLLGISAAILVRFGVLGGSITSGGQFLLAWLVLAVAVLVLSDRVTGVPTPTTPMEGTAGPLSAAIRTIGVVAAVVIGFAVVLAPLVLPHLGDPTEAGKGPTLGPSAGNGATLRATESMDMTVQPDLSDEVVFTVETDRATFWRGQTFDAWDGTTWTRTSGRFQPLAGGGTVEAGPDDLGASGDDVVEQRFRIEAVYADVVYAAPSAVTVDIDRDVRQRADGTLVSAPMGTGATYTVVSRRQPLSPERLRAVDGGTIPKAVVDQYAQPPVATGRVLDAATDVTADATTQYDKVLALEAWMGERVEYSLEAPVAPKDVDVVDHFLFEAEQGWCQQIASSLVVLARANGIPARLVTGYVPEGQDPVTGLFTVRARDAHAWAEVWFPEVGWVPFDPTADVPLAGNDATNDTIAHWIATHLVVLGLAFGAVLVAAGPARVLVRRLLARRAARPRNGLAMANRQLDQLGARVGRPRRDHETARAYVAALAEHVDDVRLSDVGAVLDNAQYAPEPPSAESVDSAAAVVSDVLAAVGTKPPG